MSDTNLTVWSIVSGGLSGFSLAILTALGLKSRIDQLTRFKVDTSAFKEFKDAQTTEHRDMKKDVDKLFNKLEEIHKDMPKRDSDGRLN